MDIVAVEGGIAPSPYAGIGLNVMRAVLGYAGGPVRLMRGGKAAYGTGLAESRRFTIAVPGKRPLRNLRFSLVDVPDLQVLPPEHPALTDIWIGAGPVPEILHRLLNGLAKARAALRLPSFAPLAPLFYAVLNRTRFGEHRGGMVVRARGIAGGRDVQRSWHLLAEGDDGPYIPSMAIEAVIRQLLAGTRPAAGARAGTHALELADYAALFEGRAIHTGFRTDEPDAPLYRRLLGSAFATLPPRVRQLHDRSDLRRWIGHAEIRRGDGTIARLIGSFIGFPEAGSQVPVVVTFSPEGRAERWTRNFAGQSFSSLQSAGAGRNEYLLVERFGLVAVALALVIEGDRLCLIPRRWGFLGVPMPQALLPKGRSFETEEKGQFVFDVEISLPFFGLIAAYRGTLSPG